MGEQTGFSEGKLWKSEQGPPSTGQMCELPYVHNKGEASEECTSITKRLQLSLLLQMLFWNFLLSMKVRNSESLSNDFLSASFPENNILCRTCHPVFHRETFKCRLGEISDDIQKRAGPCSLLLTSCRNISFRSREKKFKCKITNNGSHMQPLPCFRLAMIYTYGKK